MKFLIYIAIRYNYLEQVWTNWSVLYLGMFEKFSCGTRANNYFRESNWRSQIIRDTKKFFMRASLYPSRKTSLEKWARNRSREPFNRLRDKFGPSIFAPTVVTLKFNGLKGYRALSQIWLPLDRGRAQPRETRRCRPRDIHHVQIIQSRGRRGRLERKKRHRRDEGIARYIYPPRVR